MGEQKSKNANQVDSFIWHLRVYGFVASILGANWRLVFSCHGSLCDVTTNQKLAVVITPCERITQTNPTRNPLDLKSKKERPGYNGSWEFFFSAAPTAQNSPEFHFRFINSFI